MGNKHNICYECGGTVLASDSNTNYEPIIQMVHGRATTMHRHKDCSKGNIIVNEERPKAQVQVVGGGGSEFEELDEDFENEVKDSRDEEGLLKKKNQKELDELLKLERQEKKLQLNERMEEILKRLAPPQFPQQLQPKSKPDDGSVTLSRAERETLAAALYVADVVEITGEKLVNPRRFDAEEKKVLYKIIKGL